METIAIFFRVLLWFILILFLIGMYKPWMVLWFLDFKNRKSVLFYYGSLLLLLLIINWILHQLGY